MLNLMVRGVITRLYRVNRKGYVRLTVDVSPKRTAAKWDTYCV